jgi:pimeloyl-ACP methyl ester carboxylesterase
VGLNVKIAGIPVDPWGCFRDMTMPGLLLRGELSDVLTVDIVERMRRVKPDLQVVTVPGRGHAPLLDEPVARRAIDNFLDDARRHR